MNFKVLRNVFAMTGLFVCMQFLFMSNVSGYLDPSAMTYVIQVVAGIVIAGGAALTIYWKRIRLFLKKGKNALQLTLKCLMQTANTKH